MANAKVKVKRGMGGSRNGRSRREGTEIMKAAGKKASRAEGKAAIRLQLET